MYELRLQKRFGIDHIKHIKHRWQHEMWLPSVYGYKSLCVCLQSSLFDCHEDQMTEFVNIEPRGDYTIVCVIFLTCDQTLICLASVVSVFQCSCT
jgi:hypothetical protein